MNLLTAIIFLYSIPTIKESHGLVFSESDILNVVKTLEDKIESQEKRIALQGKRIRLLEKNCELNFLDPFNFTNVLLEAHKFNSVNINLEINFLLTCETLEKFRL